MFASTLNVARKYGSKALAVASMGTVGLAQAAVPTEVTTTLSSALTDVGTIGASVFGIVVAIALFKWFRRAL